MSGNNEDYDDIDFLLEKKEEELRELGAMRVKSLEKANEELTSQLNHYCELLQSKDNEIEMLQEEYMGNGHTREEYEHQFCRLKEIITQKDIEISDLKTSVNTYYNDLMAQNK